MDGTVEIFKINKENEENMPQIEGQATSISMCSYHDSTIIAIGRPDGSLELYDVPSGQVILSAKYVSEGPAIINSEETFDISITDPTRKIHNITQTESNYIAEIQIRAFNDIIVICACVNSGEILIYKSFGNFSFSRVTSSLYLGPSE